MPLSCADGATQGHFHGLGPLWALRPPDPVAGALACLNRSDVDAATLDALRITRDRLCSEYPFMPGEQLLIEGRQWLRRVVELHSKSLTLGCVTRVPRLSEVRISASPRHLCHRAL